MTLIRALAILALSCVAMAEEVPPALLRGILATESHSTIRADGSIEYGDQRVGAAGERGPTQIGRMVIRQWHLSAHRLQTDTRYAMAATIRHLLWLRAHLDSWEDVPAAYNGGINGRFRIQSITYARRVKAAGESQ